MRSVDARGKKSWGMALGVGIGEGQRFIPLLIELTNYSGREKATIYAHAKKESAFTLQRIWRALVRRVANVESGVN